MRLFAMEPSANAKTLKIGRASVYRRCSRALDGQHRNFCDRSSRSIAERPQHSDAPRRRCVESGHGHALDEEAGDRSQVKEGQTSNNRQP